MARISDDRRLEIELCLCDTNPEVLDAIRFQFERHPHVRIVDGGIESCETDAVICPGNGFGFMDSGFSHDLSELLGWEHQDALRERIREEHDGELLVGQALVHRTGSSPAWIIYTPTVRTPRSVDGTLNAYLALRGALIALRDHGTGSSDAPIRSVVCPGLCTGCGGMHPRTSVRQMRHAFEVVTGLRGFGDKNLSGLTRREAKLRALPASVREGEAET